MSILHYAIAFSNVPPYISVRRDARILSLSHGGMEFTFAGPSPPSVLFYDWLLDANARISGLELHFHLHDDFVNQFISVLWRTMKLDDNLIVSMVFGDDIKLGGMGLEAFDDITFGIRDSDKWLVIIGLDLWLNRARRQELIEKVASLGDYTFDPHVIRVSAEKRV